jgi:PadR family transcriptional regulator AphA
MPMKKELAPEWALLGLLTQKPMHGYELHRYFTDPSALGQVWYLGLSQMYKLLKELEGQGYLEVTLERQENYPARKVYHITPSGRAAFLQWMEKPVSSTRLIRVEFLAKLFLAQLLGAEMIERVIDTQLEACQTQLTRLLDAETRRGGGRGREWRMENGEWRLENGDWRMEDEDGRRDATDGFGHLIFCFRRGQIQAVIDWLRTCRSVFLGGGQETLPNGRRVEN